MGMGSNPIIILHRQFILLVFEEAHPVLKLGLQKTMEVALLVLQAAATIGTTLLMMKKKNTFSSHSSLLVITKKSNQLEHKN